MIALIFTAATYGPSDVFLTFKVPYAIFDLLLLKRKLLPTKSRPQNIRLPLNPRNDQPLQLLMLPRSRILWKGYLNPTHPLLLKQILLRLATKAPLLHRHLEINPPSTTPIIQTPPPTTQRPT